MHGVHLFDASREARGTGPGDDPFLQDGDAIVIPSWPVVGLASTKPVAAAAKAGELRRALPRDPANDAPPTCPHALPGLAAAQTGSRRGVRCGPWATATAAR